MTQKFKYPHRKTTLNLTLKTREQLAKICKLTGLTRRETMERALLKYFDEFNQE